MCPQPYSTSRIQPTSRPTFLRYFSIQKGRKSPWNIHHSLFLISFQLSYVLSWTPIAPVAAISFFSRMYPQHPLTHQYAVRVLGTYEPETLLFYVPQLVQGTRYDKVNGNPWLDLSISHHQNWDYQIFLFECERGTKWINLYHRFLALKNPIFILT